MLPKLSRRATVARFSCWLTWGDERLLTDVRYYGAMRYAYWRPTIGVWGVNVHDLKLNCRATALREARK